MSTSVFKRYELKYLLTQEQYMNIIKQIIIHTIPDEYPSTTICSIYYDTENRLLIRKSIEKLIYKEKLRIRSYGVVGQEDNVFVELKNKYDGVVYKRRVRMRNCEAINYLKEERKCTSQIEKEINYFKKRYQRLIPSIFLSYDRIAYYDESDKDIRITFDSNIRYRDYDLDLTKGIYGEKLIEDNQILMEIKTGTSVPMWLSKLLSHNKIYKVSFSKYGRAYMNIFKKEREDGRII